MPVARSTSRPTMKTIANNLGVSIATVSKALAGKEDIGIKMQQDVRKEAERVGYVMDRIAGTLVSGKSNTIGVIFPHFRAGITSIVASIDKVLAARGFNTILIPVRNNPEQEQDAIRLAIGMRLDGIIVNSSLPAKRVRKLYGDLEFPTVIMENNLVAASGFGQTYYDKAAGTREGAERMLQLGHRRFGLLMSLPGNRDKIEGVESAVKGKGTVKFLPTWEKDIERVPPELEAELRKPVNERCTAFFTSSDSVATWLVYTAGKLGLECPRDLSVVGFHDQHWAQCASPPLSTVFCQFEAYGEKTAELLIQLIRSAQDPLQRPSILQHRVPCVFMERKSSGRVPDGA